MYVSGTDIFHFRSSRRGSIGSDGTGKCEISLLVVYALYPSLDHKIVTGVSFR